MTDNDSTSYWQAVAPQPKHPAVDRVHELYNRRQQLLQQPEPGPVEESNIGDVAEVRHAGEFVNAESPRPHMLSAEEQVSLRLGYGALPYPIPPAGLRDPAYQEAQQYAAGHTSLSGPHRDISSTTRNGDQS